MRDRTSLRAVCSFLVISAICTGCSGTEPQRSDGRPEVLRVGIVPNVAPEDQRAKYEPLADYLRETLDLDVELFVATNYAGTVAALESDQLDLAYLGGLTYVQARQRMDVQPIVTEVDQETGTPYYYSQIITRPDSGITSLEDLDGEDFAFGDPSSTSGSLYPRIMLDEAGFECSTTSIDSCPPLDDVLFTGGHDATAQAVVNGQVAAGGIEARILHRLQADGTVPDDLVVLDEREVLGYPWVVPTALDDDLTQQIIDAFLAIDDPELLDLLRAADYQQVAASDYDEVEEAADRLGLLAGA